MSHPSWLPPNWYEISVTGQPKVKHYHNTRTGQRFNSKEDLIRYLRVSPLYADNPLDIDALREERNQPKPVVVKKPETPQVKRKYEKKRKEADAVPVPEEKNGTPKRENKKARKETNNLPMLEEKNGSLKSTAKGKKLNKDKKLAPSNIVVEGVENPDWLPPGWITGTKTVKSGARKGTTYKCFIDPISKKKFYSKEKVLSFTGTGNNSMVGQENAVDSTNGSHGEEPLSELGLSKTKESVDGPAGGISPSEPERNEIPKWLPSDFAVEVKESNPESSIQRKFKVYIAPSGNRFYSRPQVERYLASLNSRRARQKKMVGSGDPSEVKSSSELDEAHTKTKNKRGRPKKKRGRKDEGISGRRGFHKRSSKLAVQRRKIDNKKARPIKVQVGENNKAMEPADWLPSGWTKEYKLRKYAGGTVQDTYFTDPDTGYMFRSKPDVLRFLKTGDIKTCKIRPMKRVVNDLKPASAVNVKKETVGTTSGRLHQGEESPKAETDMKENDNVSPDSVAALISSAEVSTEIHAEDTSNELSKTDGGNAPVSAPTGSLQDKAEVIERKVVRGGSKKKKISVPVSGRSSKRLKGLEPDIKAESVNQAAEQAEPEQVEPVRNEEEAKRAEDKQVVEPTRNDKQEDQLEAEPIEESIRNEEQEERSKDGEENAEKIDETNI